MFGHSVRSQSSTEYDAVAQAPSFRIFLCKSNKINTGAAASVNQFPECGVFLPCNDYRNHSVQKRSARTGRPIRNSRRKQKNRLKPGEIRVMRRRPSLALRYGRPLQHSLSFFFLLLRAQFGTDRPNKVGGARQGGKEGPHHHHHHHHHHRRHRSAAWREGINSAVLGRGARERQNNCAVCFTFYAQLMTLSAFLHSQRRLLLAPREVRARAASDILCPCGSGGGGGGRKEGRKDRHNFKKNYGPACLPAVPACSACLPGDASLMHRLGLTPRFLNGSGDEETVRHYLCPLHPTPMPQRNWPKFSSMCRSPL